MFDKASEYFFSILVDYVDIDYSLWLSWLLMPLLVTFLLPAVIILLFYISAIIFHLYRLYRQKLVGSGVGTDFWERSRKMVAAVWDAHGWLWHGYEISGMENIPESGPVLFIFYHGALPVDMYYFMSKVLLYRDRLIHTVADRLLFKIPGWAIILEGLHVLPGTVQQCVNVLKDGNMLAISPGGVYEAQFGSHHYRLLWKQRRGFAKVALEAKVQIVPLFTRNVREAFRTVGLLRRIFLKIYTWTRVPLAPVYGGFPVKLVTHVGKPIPHDPNLTPDGLHLKISAAVEALIEEHQRIPGSITRALIERVYCVPKKHSKSKKVTQPECEETEEEIPTKNSPVKSNSTENNDSKLKSFNGNNVAKQNLPEDEKKSIGNNIAKNVCENDKSLIRNNVVRHGLSEGGATERFIKNNEDKQNVCEDKSAIIKESLCDDASVSFDDRLSDNCVSEDGLHCLKRNEGNNDNGDEGNEKDNEIDVVSEEATLEGDRVRNSNRHEKNKDS